MPATHKGTPGYITSTENVVRLDPRQIIIDPARDPRKHRTAEHQARITQSIVENGWFDYEPVKVVKDGGFYLIDGFTRINGVLEAISQGIEILSITALVVTRQGDPMEQLATSILANNGHEPLSALDLATGYSTMVSNGWDIARISKRLGVSPQHVRDILTLLDATPAVIEAQQTGLLSQSAAVKVIKEAEKTNRPQKEVLQKHLDTHQDGRKTRYTMTDEEKIVQALEQLADKYGDDAVRKAVRKLWLED